MINSVSYSFMGAHGGAQYFHYSLADVPGMDNPSDAELIDGAVDGAEHFGGAVDHDARCVTVYPMDGQIDNFQG